VNYWCNQHSIVFSEYNNEAANTRRAGKAGKEERGSEPTCAKLIGDGPDEAKDNVVLTRGGRDSCSRWMLKLKCDA
jgi:hypothetical protein